MSTQLKEIAAHVTRIEAGIKRLLRGGEALAQRYKILTSIPGVGPVVAVTLIACLAPSLAPAMPRKSPRWPGLRR